MAVNFPQKFSAPINKHQDVETPVCSEINGKEIRPKECHFPETRNDGEYSKLKIT